MNERVLHTLEYDKILASLCEKAGSEAGRRICKNTLPVSDREEIEKLQEETASALARIERCGSLSFSGIPMMGDIINRVALEATLGAGELRKIASLLSVALRVKQYGDKGDKNIEKRESGDASEIPEIVGRSDGTVDVLSERFALIEPLEYISREINRCIISDEEIADDASRSLFEIRRQMRQKKAKISEKIATIAREAAEEERLQDNLVTMRNGRYCIPVKAEHKGKVPGMIHDRSQTGSTFFIEPAEVVELNNEIRELEIREAEEIERILQMLSASLVPEIENLKYDIAALGELDGIFARGMLAKEMKAQRPKFSSDHSVALKKARHPLIHPKQVVPVDLELGKNFNLLVITGPNTGGKTVSLKTMGLFHLMGQSGLHIPALYGSELAIFEEIYADIGDEQSIEQSLSTFSSHMTHTVEILEKANENSLVLFDELGAGTDPVEGAALAMSILDNLNSRNVRTMATTHYSELKAYALTTPGVTNGSCEFDVETLKPTYRLIIGVPGKSNAFAISLRLGMSEEILNNAKALVGEKDRSFDDMLKELEDLRHEAEEARNAAKADRAAAEHIRKNLEFEKDKFAKRKEKELERAREEAAEVLREAKEYADETIRRINKQSQSFSMKEMEEDRRELRKKLEGMGPKKEEKKNRSSSHKAGDFKIGDTVHVISMDMKGTIHTLPDKKGVCTVSMGIMQYKCNITDLEIIEDEIKLPEKVMRTGAGAIKMSKSFSVSPEINLVGKYPDEAIAELEKYLDDAYLAQLEKVRVIHGRGTGALRKAVHDYLKRCRNVKSFRVGEFGEGDHGVTIVEFK